MLHSVEGHETGADLAANAVDVPDPVSTRECELKLEGDAAALETAFDSLAVAGSVIAPAKNLNSIYFDTPAGALWSRGYVLRVRKSQGKFVQTLKWPESDRMAADSRREIEVRCVNDTPDPALFGGDIFALIEEMTSGAPLMARFSTLIKRRALMLDVWGAKVEAALDIGNIIDGTSKLPVREIELELKEGDPANLYEFAEQLSAAYNLRLGVLTKSQRGFLLAAEEQAQVRRARPPELDRTMRLDDLIAVSISECLDHFIMNWPVLLQSDNPDGIHQMRVAIRRLRAILRVFHREIPHAKFASFRTEARDIASALGIARETDVFLDMVQNGPFNGQKADAGVEAFISAAGERREEGYGQAHAMLAAPQTTRFVLELRAFVARRGWHVALQAEHLINLGEPAAQFAGRCLSRLDKQSLRRGKKLAELSQEARHELRISLKNIRYCAEMFGCLFGAGRGSRKYGRSIATLQDQLGLYNDAAVSQDIVIDVERRAGQISARAAGIVTGWTERGLAMAEDDLAEGFRAFRKAPRFWT